MILVCYICNQSTDKCEGLLCETKTCLKYMCKECSEYQISLQISDKENGNFIKHQKKIYCMNCKENIDDNTIKNFLTDNDLPIIKSKFLDRKKYILVTSNQTDKDIKKFFEMQKNGSVTDEFIVSLHTKNIHENILNLHCPVCNIVIFDFDGCFSVECSNCSTHFCAWCLNGFKTEKECHDHVLYCEFTLNYGDYACSFDKFIVVHNVRKMEKINKYLKALNPKFKELVKKSIAQNIADLKIDNMLDKLKYYNIINKIFSYWIIKYTYEFVISYAVIIVCCYVFNCVIYPYIWSPILNSVGTYILADISLDDIMY